MTTDIDANFIARENTLNLRDSLTRTFRHARNGAHSWRELDNIWARTCVSLRGASQPEADEICRTAIDQIESIAARDRREREAESAKARAIADDARLFEQRRVNMQTWRERVSAPTVTAIVRTIDRLREASHSLTGRSECEADVRGFLTDIADALTAMSATLAIEAKASVQRDSDAAKAAA